MSFTYTRTITASGCGMPMMPMMPMRPMMHPMPIFGGCCRPMMGGCAVGGAVLAGACAGALLANPQVLNGIGSAFKWGYNNIIQPVWNGVIKPVWNFAYNNILKPIGSGLRWVWDHTLGWVLKKLETATSKKKASSTASETAQTATETSQAES